MSGSIRTATSADGTRIAFETAGSGDAVLLVGGAFSDRNAMAALAQTLAPDLMAVRYDRRGRGDSGDENASATEGRRARELEDLAAVIDAVGGRVSLFGHSSGGVLVLEAAAARPALPIEALIVYEPAYVIAGTRPVPDDDLQQRVEALLREGRGDDAVVLYQTEAIGLPPVMVQGMRNSPMWPYLTSLAASLPYDAALYDPGFAPPIDRLHGIAVPTLAIVGGKTFESLSAATRTVAESIPGARLVELEGEDHGILQRPDALAPLVVEFVSANAAQPRKPTVIST